MAFPENTSTASLYESIHQALNGKLNNTEEKMRQRQRLLSSLTVALIS